jgi:hypothetical protein
VKIDRIFFSVLVFQRRNVTNSLQRNSKSKQGLHSLKQHFSVLRISMRVGLSVISILLLSISLFGQEAAKPEQNAKPAQPEKSQPERTGSKKSNFELSVKTKPILNISLKAEKIKLVDIAAEMSKRLKTPIVVGASLQKEVVSIEFTELTLEPAMQLMAPAVYIDYEIDTGAVTPPKALGIFFQDANSGEPPLSPSAQGATQSILIEGHTEEGVEPQTEDDRKRLEEQPLRIQYQNNNLSVKAKKQPLALVLLKIGEELGIPVEIQTEPKDVIDAEITKLPVEDAIRKLSPNIRLFMRANLMHAERRALRLVLSDPTKTAEQGL